MLPPGPAGPRSALCFPLRSLSPESSSFFFVYLLRRGAGTALSGGLVVKRVFALLPGSPLGKQAGFFNMVFLQNVCSEIEERTSLSATLGPLLGSVTHSPFRPHLLEEINEPLPERPWQQGGDGTPAQVSSPRVLVPLEALLQVRSASSRTGPELCRGIFQECVGVGISLCCRVQIWALE